MKKMDMVRMVRVTVRGMVRMDRKTHYIRFKRKSIKKSSDIIDLKKYTIISTVINKNINDTKNK